MEREDRDTYRSVVPATRRNERDLVPEYPYSDCAHDGYHIVRTDRYRSESVSNARAI